LQGLSELFWRFGILKIGKNEKPKTMESNIKAKRNGIAGKMLSLISLLWCGQSVASSASPVFFSALAASAFAFYFLSRGNAAIVMVMVACGPIVNLSALSNDSYVYNVEIVLLTFLACWFWKNELRKSLFYRDALSISYGIFFTVILITFMQHTVAQHKELWAELRLLRGFFIGGLLLVFLKNQGEAPWKLWHRTMVATTLIVAGWGVFEVAMYGTTAGNWKHEPHSVFNGSEMLAVYLCTVIPILRLGRTFETQKAWLRGAAIAEMASFLLLLATRSRTGLIAVCIFWIVYAFRSALRSTGPGKFGRFAAITVVIFSFAAAFVIYLKTFSSLPFTIKNTPALLFSSRIGVWTGAIDSFRSYPLWGIGAGENVYNLPLQMLCQFGIFGLSAFMVFLVTVFCRNKNRTRPILQGDLHAGVVWSVAVFLIVSLAESALGNQFSYYALFLLFLAGTASKTTQRDNILRKSPS